MIGLQHLFQNHQKGSCVRKFQHRRILSVHLHVYVGDCAQLTVSFQIYGLGIFQLGLN